LRGAKAGITFLSCEYKILLESMRLVVARW